MSESERPTKARARASKGSTSSSSGGERRQRRIRRRRREPGAVGSRGNRKVRLVGLLGALSVVVLAAATYLLVVFPSRPGPGEGAPVTFTVSETDGYDDLADRLAGLGLVRSRRLLDAYLRLVRPKVAPGLHLVTDDASAQELVRRLERLGAGERAKVTIPEGWNRFDIARRLEEKRVTPAAAFLAATEGRELLHELGIDGDTAEGFLFPATYDLAKNASPEEVVRRLVTEFERRFVLLEQTHRLGRAHLEGSLGWGRREIVTLASMVEKEAAVDEERAIIASVFLNRLRDPTFKRKVLQCDPTSGYGCLVLGERVPACAGYVGKITPAINTDPHNTYSTYVREGLPPGPIANPGVKSLEAVLAPASTRYLYFVARAGRRHAFSETLEEHNAAVKDYRERTTRLPGR
jgi:UPF0755 protein